MLYIRDAACLVIDDGPGVRHDTLVVACKSMVARARRPERVADDARHVRAVLQCACNVIGRQVGQRAPQ